MFLSVSQIAVCTGFVLRAGDPYAKRPKFQSAFGPFPAGLPLGLFSSFLVCSLLSYENKGYKKAPKESRVTLYDLEVKIIYICLTLVLGAAPQVILGLTVLALSPFFQYDIRNHREIQRQD